MKFIVTEVHDGCLLRNYIINTCNISHKLLARLKAKEDGIMLNGKRVTVRAVLKKGDTLSLNIEDEEESDILPIKAKNKLRLLPPLNIPWELFEKSVEIIKKVASENK